MIKYDANIKSKFEALSFIKKIEMRRIILRIKGNNILKLGENKAEDELYILNYMFV